MNVATAVYRRYVALGDSLTEGLGDDGFQHERIFSGWADRLAVLLNEDAYASGEDFLYANLAVRSQNCAEILSTQVTQALILRPDLVTIMAGANDLWRPGKDWQRIESLFEDAIARLQAAHITVVLANCINPVHHWTFIAGKSRAQRLSSIIESLARKYNVTVLDVYRSSTLRRLRVWSEDCVHFGPRGHAHVANKAAKLLGLPYRVKLPKLAIRRSEFMTFSEHLSWLRIHVSPFVSRRIRGIAAGDGITSKRPVLSRVHDHPWQIERVKTSSLVYSGLPRTSVPAFSR